MKKHIILLLGALFSMMSFSSCTDKDDVEISFGTTMNVSAAHIFDSFQAIKTSDFDLTKYAGWNIEILSYVYDESGNLVDEIKESSDNINLSVSHELTLLPGKYKVVSIAHFGMQEGSGLYFYWEVKNPSSLSTLSIEELKEGYRAFTFETLGTCVTDLTITNKPQNINIEIPPVTGLIDVFFWGEDMTGFGKNGYSEMSPYCQEVNIWAPNLKQQVKFLNGTISYEYGEQNQEFNIAKFTPKEYYQNGNSADIYNYRALLPIQDRDFYWDIRFDRGKGSLFGLKDFQESDYTTKLTIESGKQYDLDLMFDGKYLFVQEHDRDEDWTRRKERLIKGLNSQAFYKIMDRNFDEFIGASKSKIESTFGKGYEDENYIYYFGYDAYVRALVFKMDESNTVIGISLVFQNINSYFHQDMIEYLNKRFTVFEKGTDEHKKAFINAPTLEEATIGIVWYPEDEDLTYIKLK